MPNFSEKPHLLSTLTLLLLCMGLAACSRGRPSPESPIPAPPATALPTATQEPLTEPGFISSPVFVDEIEILILEPFPVQVYVEVSGNLATPCSELTLPVQTIEPNNLISLMISSRQKKDTTCVQMLEPFEKTFALDVLGLPAGTYQVSVNGISGEFTLMVDNE